MKKILTSRNYRLWDYTWHMYEPWLIHFIMTRKRQKSLAYQDQESVLSIIKWKYSGSSTQIFNLKTFHVICNFVSSLNGSLMFQYFDDESTENIRIQFSIQKGPGRENFNIFHIWWNQMIDVPKGRVENWHLHDCIQKPEIERISKLGHRTFMIFFSNEKCDWLWFLITFEVFIFQFATRKSFLF